MFISENNDRPAAIISGGAIGSILTSAVVKGYLKSIYGVDAPVEFTQPFQVGAIAPESFPANSEIIIVGLPVNNDKSLNDDGEPKGFAMSRDFISGLYAAGHTVTALIDTQSSDDWKAVFNAAGADFDSLLLKPVSHHFDDAAELVRDYMENLACLNEFFQERLDAASAAYGFDFSHPLADVVNRSTKSAIADNSRRVESVNQLSHCSEPSTLMISWMDEYAELEKAHVELVENGEDLGGIFYIDSVGRRVDFTMLASIVYSKGYEIFACKAEVFNKAIEAKEIMISFSTNNKDLNLLQSLQDAGVQATGFAAKANVPLSEEKEAFETLRK